jgi:hypothetical protein
MMVGILDTIIEKLQSIEKMEGPMGPQGEPGESIVGPQGERGPQGLIGPQGANGKDGRDGKDGKKGDKGDRGPAGKDGKDGVDGIDGTDGLPATPEEVIKAIQKEGLDAKYIKNIPSVTRQLPSVSLFPSRGGSKTLEVPGAGQDIRKVIFSGGLTPTRSGDGVATISAPSSTAVIEATFDGGGSTLTTGTKLYLEIPFACIITGVTVLADVSGSIVIDIWKDTYANYPPTVADTITASAKPTISSAVKAQDTTLTGWTTAISAGDILGFNIDSITTIKLCTLSLKVTKS